MVKAQFGLKGNGLYNARPGMLGMRLYHSGNTEEGMAEHVRKKVVIQGILWICVYIALSIAPLFILLIKPSPEGREFWRELSVALGFAGLAMVMLQFVLTARFKVMKAPYGSDIVYYFHRQISIVAFLLILVHPLILFVFNPVTLRLLNVFQAPWRARAGVTALCALMALVITSVWRRVLKIEYNRWRIGHGILATVAVSLGMAHIMLVNHYVNTPLKRFLWVGYALFWVGLLVYVRIIKPLIMLQKPYEVKEVKAERGDAWSLVVVPHKHPGIRFMPGQFAWLTIGTSPFSDAEHPFSISSSAAEAAHLTFTIKALGDFTSTIKDLASGVRVYVDGPFGAFSIDRHPQAERFVFIAGGIGMTPMMSMLRTMADRQDQRPCLLVYANRTWEGVTFREEIEQLQYRLNLQVVWVLSAPDADWTGESGRITAELLDHYLPRSAKRHSQEVFICGPMPMMDTVERALVHLGISVDDFHSERFDLV